MRCLKNVVHKDEVIKKLTNRMFVTLKYSLTERNIYDMFICNWEYNGAHIIIIKQRDRLLHLILYAGLNTSDEILDNKHSFFECQY